MKKRINKFFKVMLSLAVMLPLAFLAGCDGNEGGTGDEGGDNGFTSDFKTWEYVEGFRASVKNSNAGEEAISSNLFENFSEAISNNLNIIYGRSGELYNKYFHQSKDHTHGEGVKNPYIEKSLNQENSYLLFDSIKQEIVGAMGSSSSGQSAPIVVSNYESSWKWTYGFYEESTTQLSDNKKDNVADIYDLTSKNNFIDRVIEINDEKNNVSPFNQIYGQVLEINILETILGYEISKVEPYYFDKSSNRKTDINIADQTQISISVDNQEFQGPFLNKGGSYPLDSAIAIRLAELRADYAKKASYSGIDWNEDADFQGKVTQEAKSDGGRIVKLILDNVIGKEVVEKDNDVIAGDTIGGYEELKNVVHAKRYYELTVTAMVKDLVEGLVITSDNVDAVNTEAGGGYKIGDKAGAFFPMPGIQYVDYRLNDFIAPSTGNDDFRNSPANEYQSVCILPKKDVIFEGASLHFQSMNRNLDINVKVRYYDFQTKTVKLESMGIINIMAGAYDFETNENSIMCEPANQKLKLNPFSPSTTLPPKPIIENKWGFLERRTTSDFFQTIPSDNGYGSIGVMNEARTDFSFMEFVFDVIKDPLDPPGTDYAFQVVMFLFACTI